MLDKCNQCSEGKLLTYVTRRLATHIVRYKRCSTCRCTSKHVQTISHNRIESSTDFLGTLKTSHMIQAVEITHTHTEQVRW